MHRVFRLGSDFKAHAHVDLKKLRVRRIEPDATHIQLAQTYTRIIGLSSSSDSRVGVALPGLVLRST